MTEARETIVTANIAEHSPTAANPLASRPSTRGAVSLSGVWRGLAKFMGDFRAYRQTLKELRHYTDAELAELGIDRAWVSSVARRMAFGPQVPPRT